MDRFHAGVGMVVLALLLLTASASLTVYPLSNSETCSQVNSTFIACYDGYSIPVSFSVTAPNSPSFGPFRVSQVDYANVSQPLDSFGNQCAVQSGATISCFISIKALPLSVGNGTVEKSIQLRLTSQPYPQLAFNRSINITIYHYLSHNESVLFSIYNSTSSAYLKDNATYGYFCRGYGICSANVGYGISVTGSYLELASENINYGSMQAATYNASVANRSINGLGSQYAFFVNNSNRIVNNVIEARSLLSAASNHYVNDEPFLNVCTVGNSTYGKNIQLEIQNAEGYPMETNLTGSVKYLQLATNISDYTNNAIAQCKTSGQSSGKTGVPGSISKNTIYIIIIAIILILILIYVVLRYRSDQEIRRIREDADEKRAEELHAQQKGERGERGRTGRKGMEGEQGIEGKQGEPGEPGKQGEPGMPGEPGAEGEEGRKGETGSRGRVGEHGVEGKQGEPGETGISGEPGTEGERGSMGEPGKKGKAGRRGRAGKKGEHGKNAEHGEQPEEESGAGEA
jgi:hypothetical protein